jgi:pimeloyl-ACP methyl ester carboxylesterase
MLLVWGDRDPVLPVSHARAATRDLPGCRLEVVPGAGHLPHQSDPARFVLVVDDFLRASRPARHDPHTWRRLLDSRSLAGS